MSTNQAAQDTAMAIVKASPAIGVAATGATGAVDWLGVDPAHIAAYVRRHRIAFVDDDSNADPRYARSRLRLRVWPALIWATATATSSSIFTRISCSVALPARSCTTLRSTSASPASSKSAETTSLA